MKIEQIHEAFVGLSDSLKKVIVGKEVQIEKTLVCILAEGHLLLEDMPGVGKTTLASALAMAIGGVFNRIQFTADLLPSDVIGARIYRRQTEDFEFIRGPIFANVVLADELNRAPPKTQSALLQAMNEFAVSVEKHNIDLARPFMVIATQNPRGFQGTYPLPESQRDRFMIRVSLGYPSEEAELAILKLHCGNFADVRVSNFLKLSEVVVAQTHTREIPVSEPVLKYISRLMASIRSHPDVELPVSPRGSISLMRAAQAIAFLRNRPFVTVDMIKEIVPEVLAHRIGLRGMSSFGREGANCEWLASEVLQKVDVD